MKLIDFMGARGALYWASRAFIIALVWTVLAYGSAAEAPFHLAAIAFALLSGLSAFRPIYSVPISRLYGATAILLAALALYVIFQIMPIAGGFSNEAWSSVNQLVGPVRGTVSVAPGMTYDALPRLTLPFLVFLSALALFQGDADALKLWRALSYFGVGYAVFGILQDAFFPGQLVFAKKRFYLDNLTASFVNHNTAGTFFGLALLLNLGLFFYYLRNIRVHSFLKKVTAAEITWGDKHAIVLLHALFTLIIAVALFLTQSRGAVASSFVGAIAGVSIMLKRTITADKPKERTGEWRRYATNAAVVLAVIGLFALFAGRTVYRMEEQGTNDLRWCVFASAIEAIKDHPLFGTGFAAFQDVFPPYRDADCVGVNNVWDHAHDFFLEGYLGLGAPFVVALLFSYVTLIGLLLKGLRNRHTLRFVPAMGIAALVLVTLHSIVDFSLQIPGFAVYFAAVMASTATICLGRGNAGVATMTRDAAERSQLCVKSDQKQRDDSFP